jgi:hypothetical protein
VSGFLLRCLVWNSQIFWTCMLLCKEIHELASDAPCLVFTGKLFKIVGRVQYEVSKSLDLYVNVS